MRVFNVSRTIFNGSEVLSCINLNLTKPDCEVIIAALEKFKCDDVVLASSKTAIVSSLKPFLS